MRHTVQTDYALRILMFLAARPEALTTIAEIARAYGISKNHLMKIVQRLARVGLIDAMRGRCGGLKLGRPAHDITVGEVVRLVEEDFRLVECFDPEQNRCVVTDACLLKHTLKDALDAYLAVLDRRTLADLVARPVELNRLLMVEDQ